MGTYAWDPLNTKTASIALSNNDRTATALVAGTTQNTRSEWKKSSGKWYWEIRHDVGRGDYQTWGICRSDGSTDYTINTRAGWNESWAMMYNGRAYHDGSYNSKTYSTSEEEILGFALDLDTGKLFCAIDNVWQSSANPVLGLNPQFSDSTMTGYDISATYSTRIESDASTTNFKSDELVYAPPTGFAALDDISEEGFFMSNQKRIINHVNLRR